MESIHSENYCCNNLPGGGGGGGGVVVSGQGIWVQFTLPSAIHVLGKRKRERFASHFVIGICLSPSLAMQ